MEADRATCKRVTFCSCIQLVLIMLYSCCVLLTVFTVNELEFNGELNNITDNVISEYVAELDVVFIMMNQVFTNVPVIGLLVVYLWLPHLQNLQGKIVMSYLVACAVARASEAVMYVYSDNVGVHKFVFKYVTVPFGLSQFTWVTLMCFDISNTFSRPLQGPSIQANIHTWRFLLYSLYGWGFPGLFVALPSGLEIVLVLLTVILKALLCVMMFASTITDLVRHRLVTLSSRLRAHGNTAPDWLLISLKLALLMIMDSALFFMETAFEFGPVLKLVDIFLAFQGTILFILLVYNKRITGVLRNRFTSYKQQNTENIDTNNTSV